MAITGSIDGGNFSNPTSVGVTSTVVGAVLSNATLVNTSTLEMGKIVTNDGTDGIITLDGAPDNGGVVVTAVTAATVVGGSGVNQLIASNDAYLTTITTGTGSGTVIGGAGGQLLGTAAEVGGTYQIYAGSGDDTVIAASGNNTITSGHGNNIVAAFGGNNAIVASGTNDTVIAAGGNNLILAINPGGMLAGLGGNTTIVGSSGDDFIIGSSASDATFMADGGAGNDVIFAGKGTNALLGGEGRDMFVFSSVYGGGKSVIGDFKAGTDTLAISGYSGLTVGSLLNSAVNTANGVVITLGQDKTTILISGVTDKNTLNGSIVIG
ncbi:calcium-binding protein [Azospirillum brasilense]